MLDTLTRLSPQNKFLQREGWVIHNAFEKTLTTYNSQVTTHVEICKKKNI